MSKLTSAYVAGFVDGEGYVSLKKGKVIKGRQYYTPTVKVASTEEEIIKWLKDSFGGWYYRREYENQNYKDAFYWTLTGKNLKPFLQKIYPYLRIKKEQAKLVLRKIKIQETLFEELPYKNISQINPQREEKRLINLAYRDKVRKEIENIYWKLRELNQRGKNNIVQPERLSEVTRKGNDSPSL